LSVVLATLTKDSPKPRFAMATPNRPKRVVVVDADNPLVEIQGEFFWREDHEVLVAAAREEGYRTGYQAGWGDAARQAAPGVIEIRRRHSLFVRARRMVLGLMLLGMLLIVLATIGEQLFAMR
jgi:hypothetical protein